MVDRLVVDTAAVRQCAEALERLGSEFDNAEGIAGSAMDVIGDHRVADRLHEFATNWTRHRRQIATSMTELSQVCRALADTLDEVDQALARAQRAVGP